MTDDLEQWFLTEATYQYANARIKQLENTHLEIQALNSLSQSFSAEITDRLSSLKDDKNG